MKRPLTALALLLAPLAMIAQSAPRVQEYSIDAGHSIVEFSIGFAFSRVKGRFTNVKGTILYDSLDPGRSSVTVAIESKTIDTGWPHRDEHLRTSDFFDVETYPTILFQSDRLARTPSGWQADGKLTMHGVTRAVSIPVRFPRKPSRSPESSTMILNAEGTLRIARTDFGILGGATYNSWFDKARAATMSDGVDVSLEIEGWTADAKSQLLIPAVDAAIQRTITGGVQPQINRITAAAKAQPNNVTGVVNGGDFVSRGLVAAGKTADAVALSRATAEAVPASARAQMVYGAMLGLSGDEQGAFRQYAKAKEVFTPPVRDPNEKFPQDDDNWYYLDNLVRTLLEWNRAAPAVPLARTISELYPGTARAHTTLGVALAATGDARGAAAAYARALAIDPNETRALEYRRR